MEGEVASHCSSEDEGGAEELTPSLLSLRLITASETVGPPDGKHEREKDGR